MIICSLVWGESRIIEKEITGYGQLAFLYFLSQDEPYKSFGTPWPCSWHALLLKAGAHLMICVGHATTHNGFKSFLKEKKSFFCHTPARTLSISGLKSRVLKLTFLT